MKRFVAIALALLLVAAALPMSVLAQSGVELPIVELDDVKYEWADNYTTCTATFGEGDAAKSETVQTQITGVIPATCTTPEKTVYTATFTTEGFETQTKEVPNGTALGHTWGEVSYVWAEDNSTCTATRTCTREGCAETETETVNTTSEVTQEPKEETPGVRTYTAEFENEAFETQTKDVKEEYQAPFIWGDANDDGEVSNKDIVRLKNYLANYDEEAGVSSNGTTEYTLAQGADANGDGEISNKDIVRLKNYLANYDEETGISSNGATVYTLGPAS